MDVMVLAEKEQVKLPVTGQTAKKLIAHFKAPGKLGSPSLIYPLTQNCKENSETSNGKPPAPRIP